MCADCHSTNLVRNFDLATNTYKTTWSEINVSCETCHGPGSRHVAWADDRKRRGLTGRDDSPMGLDVQGLRAADYSGFGVGDASSLASRPVDRRRQQAEVQACAPCHARRGPITDVPDVGRTFLDSYRPAFLEDGLYYPDGQILEEVYEYASFTQSKMYAAGVTCSDCHNAHSLKQRGTGNNVCGHCHLPLTYDTPAHHHHKQGTEAARCASCHMRTTTYMVVDPRYDHSFRVPRVDYTLKYGIPNACTTPCHADKSVKWSNDAVVKWYGPERKRGNDYVVALDAARRGLPDAGQALRAAILTPAFPPMARATALVSLGEYYTPASIDALQAGLTDPDAIVRAAAARTLTSLDPPDRVRLGRPLLTDPVRLVRAWAASALAGTPPGLLTQDEAAALARASEEYLALEMAVAERPEAHLNLSTFYLRQGKTREAEAALHTALRLDPRSVPARVNLADLYRTQGREAEGREGAGRSGPARPACRGSRARPRPALCAPGAPRRSPDAARARLHTDAPRASLRLRLCRRPARCRQRRQGHRRAHRRARGVARRRGHPRRPRDVRAKPRQPPCRHGLGREVGRVEAGRPGRPAVAVRASQHAGVDASRRPRQIGAIVVS